MFYNTNTYEWTEESISLYIYIVNYLKRNKETWKDLLKSKVEVIKHVKFNNNILFVIIILYYLFIYKCYYSLNKA